MSRRLHRINAVLLGVFLILHLATHVVLVVAGAESHLSVMRATRPIYGHDWIEPVLFALIAFQIGLGLCRIWVRGRPKGAWAWAQVVSGAYLAFFLLQHLSAVVLTRLGHPDLETTTWWAASVVSRPPFVWYFGPYYALAVTALFVHLASALQFSRWPEPAGRWIAILPVIGALFGVAVVLALMGLAEDLPTPYRAYLDSYGF